MGAVPLCEHVLKVQDSAFLFSVSGHYTFLSLCVCVCMSVRMYVVVPIPVCMYVCSILTMFSVSCLVAHNVWG